MKNQRFLLSEEDEEDLTIGLVRLTKNIPAHELFFSINSINESKLKRIDDVRKEGYYFDYFHSRFETYHFETQTCFQFISNKSTEHFQKEEITQLFVDESDINYLLPNHKDVDYILKTSDTFADFSLILLPENLMFHIEEFHLDSDEELYHLIQYYE